MYAVALAALVVVPSFAAALFAMVFAGLTWMAVTSTLQAELQLVLPAWVRARGLAMYTVTFMGSNAVGALLWAYTRVSPAVIALLVVIPVWTMLARLYAGAHHVSDVLSAFVAASVWLLVCAGLLLPHRHVEGEPTAVAGEDTRRVAA